jgi:hypothetical protein
MTRKSRAEFPLWLSLFILVVLLQGATFLSFLYLLAECIQGNDRWLLFGIVLGINLVLFALIHFLNHKMSAGQLGSSMQKLRISRFTAAFLNVTFASLISTGFAYLFDEVLYPLSSSYAFGPLGVLLIFAGGTLEFVFTYSLFQGQGISRL